MEEVVTLRAHRLGVDEPKGDLPGDEQYRRPAEDPHRYVDM
jgi:hypothetical protein